MEIVLSLNFLFFSYLIIETLNIKNIVKVIEKICK